MNKSYFHPPLYCPLMFGRKYGSIYVWHSRQLRTKRTAIITYGNPSTSCEANISGWPVPSDPTSTKDRLDVLPWSITLIKSTPWHVRVTSRRIAFFRWHYGGNRQSRVMALGEALSTAFIMRNKAAGYTHSRWLVCRALNQTKPYVGDAGQGSTGQQGRAGEDSQTDSIAIVRGNRRAIDGQITKPYGGFITASDNSSSSTAFPGDCCPIQVIHVLHKWRCQIFGQLGRL